VNDCEDPRSRLDRTSLEMDEIRKAPSRIGSPSKDEGHDHGNPRIEDLVGAGVFYGDCAVIVTMVIYRLQSVSVHNGWGSNNEIPSI
jgi:hypothetical protein